MIINKIKYLISISAIIIICTTGCKKAEDEDNLHYVFPEFKNVTEVLKKKDLFFPAGLSSKTEGRKSLSENNKSISGEISGIFIETPVYLNLRGAGGIQPFQNPRISQFSNFSGEISTNPVGELDLSVFFQDFDSYGYMGQWIILGLPDSLWRAKGLVLDCILLPDETIISSSNSSDKLFITNSSGNTEVYMQDEELCRITDMIYGTDNKIYAVKAPLVDVLASPKIIEPKKVISIKDGIIKTEFELPSTETYIPYIDNNTALYDRLKIIENSEEGKKKYGTLFYISDLLENVIYKVDTQKVVTVLTDQLTYPSSLAVDLIGTIYYSSSPLVGPTGDYRQLAYKTSIFALNPETGESKYIHTFDELTHDYETGEYFNIKLPTDIRKIYYLPVDFNVTNFLYESETKLEFIFSNSHQGTLKFISIDK
jgi:hypothetical protein